MTHQTVIVKTPERSLITTYCNSDNYYNIIIRQNVLLVHQGV